MCLVLTRERMRRTPRVTLILKQAFSPLAERIATTWRREFRERESTQAHDIVTGVHEEVMYCSPSTSSGKQEKNRSTSQPHFRRENTPATIEADQILLALQQFTNNSISANFHKNINRISKVPKSLTTTMPTFDGKSENFGLFEDLFQTSLKIHNQLTEEDRINYFHSLMRGDELQTFKNINDPTRENLGEILAVFRRKYVKPNQWRQQNINSRNLSSTQQIKI